jgi:hypothetical protein
MISVAGTIIQAHVLYYLRFDSIAVSGKPSSLTDKSEQTFFVPSFSLFRTLFWQSSAHSQSTSDLNSVAFSLDVRVKVDPVLLCFCLQYWKAFFSNLAFCVIDEAHHYKGAFGSHVVSNSFLQFLSHVCAQLTPFHS